MEEHTSRAIDCWVNPNPPEIAATKWSPKHMKVVGERVFKNLEFMAKGTPVAQMVQDMEAAGIEKGIITSSLSGVPVEMMLDVLERYPKHFIGSMGVDGNKGMETIRLIDSVVRNHNVQLIRIVPDMTNTPINDKSWWPVYAKCCELGVAVSVTVGIPGPPLPAACQNPLFLDEVIQFFPELTIVATHMGHPWTEVLVSLMLHYPNLHLMTSAWAPKYYPQSIIHFMNTRGADQVMFATDFPLLTFERCMREAADLPLKPDVRRKFMRENALRLFDWSRG